MGTCGSRPRDFHSFFSPLLLSKCWPVSLVIETSSSRSKKWTQQQPPGERRKRQSSTLPCPTGNLSWGLYCWGSVPHSRMTTVGRKAKILWLANLASWAHGEPGAGNRQRSDRTGSTAIIRSGKERAPFCHHITRKTLGWDPRYKLWLKPRALWGSPSSPEEASAVIIFSLTGRFPNKTAIGRGP